MAAYVGFEDFVLRLGEGVHQLHAAGHNLFVYLTDNAPSITADTVRADLVDLADGNGYTDGGKDITNTYLEVTGTGTLGGTTVVWTATGGTMGPFRYAVLYDDTPISPADPLIAYWDYGSSITLQDTETFTVTIGASIFTLA